MIKAVIFDMDGLLVNSEPFWLEVEEKVFSKLGVDYTGNLTIGYRADEVVDYWYRISPWKNFNKDQTVDHLIHGVTQLIRQKGELMPGVEKVISLLSKNSIPMAIASSSFFSIINAVVEKFDLSSKIKVIYSSEFEDFGKPHPGVYITTAGKIGVRVEECLVFEDSINGLIAAKSAKMKCIAVPPLDLIDDKGYGIADKVVSSLEEFDLNNLKDL